MDGFFMRRLCKRVLFCALTAAIVWSAMLIADRETLNRELIRFHVVAASDSEQDQTVKLQVRDAVLAAIREDLESVGDVREARAYLQEQLPKIQRIANETLQIAGFEPEAVVSLCREAFDIRHYDTFTLPAGVYDSLRIVIGEGAGHNWWCVAFPTLCLPAAAEGFEAVAADAGLSENLTQTLSGREKHQVRFYFLDKLGQFQNRAFAGK